MAVPGAIDGKDTAQRVRWQLDGWITRMRGAGAPRKAIGCEQGRHGIREEGRQGTTAEDAGFAGNGDFVQCGEFDGDNWDSDGIVGIVAIELAPVETVPAGSIMPGLWGGRMKVCAQHGRQRGAHKL